LVALAGFDAHEDPPPERRQRDESSLSPRLPETFKTFVAEGFPPRLSRHRRWRKTKNLGISKPAQTHGFNPRIAHADLDEMLGSDVPKPC
jgi:hypothetical protein